MLRHGPHQNKIICPHCKGEQTAIYTDSLGNNPEELICHLCNGKGIVIRKLIVSYHKL